MRYFVAVLGLLVIVAGLAGVKGKQIASLMAMGKEMQKAGPPPEAVNTAVSQEQAWEGTLSAVGSLAAVKGGDHKKQGPGVVSGIFFEVGGDSPPGAKLLELQYRVHAGPLAAAG